jgi:hypothetical protein
MQYTEDTSSFMSYRNVRATENTVHAQVRRAASQNGMRGETGEAGEGRGSDGTGRLMY